MRKSRNIGIQTNVRVVTLLIRGRLDTVDTELKMGHEIFLVHEYLTTSRTTVLELPVWHLRSVVFIKEHFCCLVNNLKGPIKCCLTIIGRTGIELTGYHSYH